LQNPVFRKLWFASLISGTCVAAHDTAATWTMNMLTNSPLLLSLMSTVASLPFFLFTLPAGALADIVDRKRLMYVMNIWLAAAAGGLAILGWLHLLSPYVLLGGVFLIGVGFAFNAPAWTAIQPEIVSNDELPSAATLGGLQLNISGIIGPAIGGLLLPWIGANSVFALNGCFFFLLIFAIAQLKRKKAPSNLPLENFLESFITAIRYVRYAPGIQVVLAPKHSVCVLYFRDSGIATSGGPEGIASGSIQPRTGIHEHGRWLSNWGDLRSPMGQIKVFIQQCYDSRECARRGRLSANGSCP